MSLDLKPPESMGRGDAGAQLRGTTPGQRQPRPGAPQQNQQTRPYAPRGQHPRQSTPLKKQQPPSGKVLLY